MSTPSSPRIVQVVIDLPTRALSDPFDYAVPASLPSIACGTPVIVPFGGQQVVGYVVGTPASSSFEGELREVEAVLGEPLFREWAQPLSEWIAEEYAAPAADAIRLFLPPGGSPSVEAVFSPVEGAAATRGRPAEVLAAVAATGVLSSMELRERDPSWPGVAAALARRGALARAWRLRPPATGAVDERWVMPVPGSGFVPAKNAHLQRSLLSALTEGPVRVAELTAEYGPVDAAMKRLEELGAVRTERRRRMRHPSGTLRSAPRHASLSDGQSAALAAIEGAGPGECVLIDGVTASGKTEVYLRAIETVIAAGDSAIMLVPEISLTPQTVGRVRSRFGDLVAVLHSRLSPGERYDQWDRVRAGEARVVVGPRSALFAPVERLALVVIDEEHETSYKQGSSPRYHARDVARRLCAITGARLVLGSATPSLESRVAAERGAISVAAMPERVGGGTLPAIRVVDMAAEFADGHRSMFSRPLLEGLTAVRERGQKAVLFLNRRGYAAFLLCRECGFVPACEQCSVSMTYHERGQRLVCHHCGRTQDVPATCPRCGSAYLRQFGAGTQRVESELAVAFPDWPIVRMDADTTRGKGGHERSLSAFEALDSGVLVGTQMIAKGLDYPDVTLVGVLNADTSLHLPDFRAAERTFQLLSQVAGRAGRGREPGEVVIQTYWPDHPAIACASRHDASTFYRGESRERSELGYPPFGALANVTVTGADRAVVRAACADLASAIEQAGEELAVLGPSPAAVERVKGRYRWHVLVKGPREARLGPVIGEALKLTGAREGASFAPDIDPYDLL